MIAALLLALALPAFAVRAPAPPPPAEHPLDALTQEEITETVAVIRGAKIFQADALFPVVALQEPPKAAVLAWRPGQPFARQAFTVVFDRVRNETSEALVDLRSKELVSWRVIPGVQPNFLVEELTSVPELVRADPRFKEAMNKRGISDLTQVLIDPWAPGTIGGITAEGPRLAHAIFFFKGTSVDFYARPIEGLVALVDLNTRKVLQLVDSGIFPVSEDDGAFDEASQPSLRPQPKPLVISQPLGPDFEVHGHEVRWQKWRFHFALHPREGLVLSQVAYEDGGKPRSILYRAALSEMVVPYGDPDSNWAWRSAFDEGEYGVGRLIAPLEPDVDVPENAVFFDAPFADDFGKAYVLPRAAALYERDGGILWKHFEFDSNHNESRRGRELVLTSVAAVGNYDYGYSWIFRQDGSLECEIALTGIMLAKGLPAAGEAGHEHDGHFMHKVSSVTAAPHHQHFFNYRLDFDVDGSSNTVYELNTRMMPAGKDNPYGNAMTVEETPLRTERAARRDLNLASGRRWIVRNPGALNALGQPVGYALVPGDNTVPYVRPESPVRKRAAFIDHHLWVSVYDADENYAAGDYPNQSRGGEGIERWTAEDDDIENRDVVVWYTLGVTHVPRPEEWPVMPVTKTGFKLLPVAFFSRNPALDVPRPPSKRKK
jgi:primary-amine oxidase